MNWAALSLWRASYEAETPDRLTVKGPPVTRTVRVYWEEKAQKYRTDITDEEEPADQNGRSLSAQMVRLLGHHEGYGLVFPVRRALAEWNRYCCRRHRTWADHAHRAVCSEIAYAVIRDRYSLRSAARQAGVSYIRAEHLLVGACRHMIEYQEEWIARTTV